MKKENWLSPVSKEDVSAFAFKHMNLERIMVLEEAEDINYGKFFRVGGFTNEPIITGWGRANNYMNPIALGQYGPLDVDEYGETTVDDVKQLFSDNENLINIYLAWVAMVSEKNKGRKLDGKEYVESFSNTCNAHIDLQKAAQVRAAEREAAEKKNCVQTFARQLGSEKGLEEGAEAKQK